MNSICRSGFLLILSTRSRETSFDRFLVPHLGHSQYRWKILKKGRLRYALLPQPVQRQAARAVSLRNRFLEPRVIGELQSAHSGILQTVGPAN